MADDNQGRWPPIYDAAGLEAQIAKICRDYSQLYDEYADLESPCQGDIIQAFEYIPIHDELGQLVQIEHKPGLWLVTGNTCDFINKPRSSTTSLSPIQEIDLARLSANTATSIKSWKTVNQFYVPSWTNVGPDAHYAAMLNCMVPVAQGYIANCNRIARLSRIGWILLHSCIVRYLARDDGRNSPD